MAKKILKARQLSLSILVLSLFFPLFAEEHKNEEKKEAPAPSEKAPEQSSHESPKDEKSNDLTLLSEKPYINVGPFKVCIIKKADVTGYLLINIALMVKKDEEYDRIKAMTPQLQNHFIIYLNHALSNFWIKESAPTVSQLKTFLQKIVGYIIDPDLIQDILVKSYFFAKEETNKEEKF
jgi:flagellar basal body-associated protein FliL